MPDLEKSHDKMSENFSKMTPAMRRHLTMHLSYLQSDCKKDALDDPLFHLNVGALNEFYQLNAFLYPSDVRTILDSCGTDKIRRALILLGQCQKPHILRQVDIEALRTEMEQVTGCGPAKQTLLDLVSRTNRTAVPFRVLLVGPSGIGKTLLGDILAAHYKPRRIDCGSISSPVALAGEESGYNNSTYGMLADAALDQADLLQFTGVDRITFGGQNGNPFPALIQLVREHTVHDLYLGTSVHVNANIIAEAESTASLPADLKGTSIVYNNSCAGVIAQALKRAGSTRAVLLLDEVDKLPAESQFALLDLLDGHRSFYEKHLDCDIDLHQLVPVLTANDLEKVSPILRDRCDLMPMYGYTPAEKKAIAQQAMLPAALKKYGLPDALFPENVTDLLVRRYCRAPGCRDMESMLNRLCETLTLYRAQEKELTVNEALLETVLGAPPAALNHYPEHLPEDTTGLVSTLAVMRSSAGVSFGSRDAVQAVLTERPGITITGFAQDALRESVQTALTAAEQLTGKTLPEGKGVHIHFCGDAPKNGASGGCAIALALASLLTGTPVPRTFALTGTVDLLGSVGKVGGIPEKTEAALAADCKLLFLPGENRDDLPPELREQADAQGMEILFADTLAEIWAKCMEL